MFWSSFAIYRFICLLYATWHPWGISEELRRLHWMPASLPDTWGCSVGLRPAHPVCGLDHDRGTGCRGGKSISLTYIQSNTSSYNEKSKDQGGEAAVQDFPMPWPWQSEMLATIRKLVWERNTSGVFKNFSWLQNMQVLWLSNSTLRKSVQWND